MKNKVVLIGVNNYNGLGLVRGFGENAIKPYGIIVGVEGKLGGGFIHKSKYWKNVWLVDHAEDSVECLLKNFSNEEEKPIVISYVDKVTQLLDARYNELSKLFILPSINQQEDAINVLANKFEQVQFAKMLGINMLETKIIELATVSQNNDNHYPVILKPVQGGEGDKYDISICYTEDEYNGAIQALKVKGYKRILQQPYLQDRQEYVVFGALDKKYDFCSYTVIHNLRQYPSAFGIGCFSEYITESNDKAVFNFAKLLMQKIMDYGYSGSIDIELFKDCNNEIYINEINWRVGGRNFVSLDTKIYSTIWWAQLQGGMDIDCFRQHTVNNVEGFSMKETEDVKNVLYHQIKFKDWIKDYRRTTNFAVKNKKDKKPKLFLSSYINTVVICVYASEI